jgi:outer membrane biosynthesis protein TonB
VLQVQLTASVCPLRENWMVCPVWMVVFAGASVRGVGCEPDPEPEPEEEEPEPDPEPEPEPVEAGEVDPEPIILAPEEHPMQRAKKKSRAAATSRVRENAGLDHEMGSAERGSAELFGSIASMKASNEGPRRVAAERARIA